MKWIETKILILLISLSASYAGAAVTITLDDTNLIVGETSVVTFTFSDAPVGFALEDVTAERGTLTDFSVTTDPQIYTATFTPTDDFEDNNTPQLTPVTFTFTSSNGNGVTGTLIMYPDNPGETFNYKPIPVVAADQLPFTIDYSATGGGVEQGGFEKIINDNANCLSQFASFPLGDALFFCGVPSMTFSVSTISGQRFLDGGNFPSISGFTANYTGPMLSFSSTLGEDEIVFNGATTLGDWVSAPVPVQSSISVSTAYTNAAGNPGAAGESAGYTIDTKEPTVVITLADSSLNIGETTTVTFTFSETPVDFAIEDITAANGALSGFSVTADAKIYTATFTPANNIEDSANVISVNTAYTDAAGNTGTENNSANYVVDSQEPAVTISGVPTNSNAAFTATITFSEAVTGFAVGGITVGNSSLSAFTGSGAMYTVLVTPTAGGNVTVDVAANVAIDAASNNNTAATQQSSAYDSVVPSVAITGVPMSSNTPFTATFTFSEAVTGFVVGGITVSNAGVSNFSAVSTTVYTALITPVANGNVTVDVAANIAIDVASNNSTAAIQQSSAYDGTAPTVAITAPSNSAGEFSVTVTFSESVSDFVVDELTTINANVSGFTGSGTTYTAIVTPINVGGNVVISVAAGVAADAASNPNIAATDATVITNNIGVVSIIGAAVEGATLSATVSDADGVSGSTFAYQWMSNSTNVGANQSTYAIQTSDVGSAITVQVTYADELSTAENIISAATASVVSVLADAANTITEAVNNNGGTPPTVDDYKNAGVVSIGEEDLTRVLSILNYAIAQQTAATDVDEVSEIEALIATIMLGQDGDSDGLPNLVEGSADTDGDGNTDDNDSDADNDGIADRLEHGLLMVDTDGDGIIDTLDADVDADGTIELGKLDANLDGVDDNVDSLTELLANDANLDRDSDGQVNYLDLDSDNDGAFDVVEAGLNDFDNNGLVDGGTALIVDAANLPDTNADNTPNIFALISDGTSRDLIVYGLPETLDENQDGKLDSTIDMDHDGIIDIVDGAVGAFGSFKDIDGDGLANHFDTDDDGDGIPDIVENPRQADFTGMDADADGIDDGVDHDVNGTLVGVDADGNGVQDDKEIPDADNDGIADHLDNDGDNDGVTDDKDISVNTGDDYKNSGGGGGAITPLLAFVLFGALVASFYSRKLLVFVVLLLGIGQAEAGQWDVGLGLGQANFDPDLAGSLNLSKDDDTAMQISLAYVFDERWLAELRYANLGEAEINSVFTVGHKVMAANVQYTLPKLPLENVSLYLLAGVAVIDLHGGAGLNIEDESSAELNLGIGARYHFSDWLVRAEFASYNANNSAFMLGLHYRF